MDFLKRIGLLVGNCSPIEYGLKNMRSDTGHSFLYKLDEEVLRIHKKVAEQIGAENALLNLLDQRYCRNKVRVYIEKYLSKDMRIVILLALTAKWCRGENRQMQVVGHTVLCENRLNALLHPYVRDLGCSLLGYPTFWRGDHLLSCLYRALRLWGAFLKCFLSALWPAENATVAKQKGASYKIAVEYVIGEDIERRSDLFWYPGSGIDASDILVYFQRPDRPATPEVLRAISAQGFQSVVLSEWKPPYLYVRRFMKVCIVAWRLMFRVSFRRIPLGFWQWDCITLMLREVNYWEVFFDCFNIRVHTSYTTVFSPSLVAQAIAVDLVGGIDVRSHTSHFPFITADDGMAHHVCFAWGPHYRDLFIQDRSGIDYLVYCGYIFDHQFPSSRDRARAMRTGLEANGAQYIVCLFDSSCAYYSFHSREKMVKFYKVFIQKLLEDPGTGLIIKPKEPDMFRQFPELREILQAAMRTNRCALLNKKVGTDFPCEAAMASDIAVGFYINSAAIEAALAGVPAIHVDLTGLPSSSFYTWGYGNIVFDDLDKLMSALKQHRRGLTKLGDHSPVLSKIDPFRDGRAGERVGRYIRGFLGQISLEKTRDDALEYANDEYVCQYGADKVVPVLARSRREDLFDECSYTSRSIF